MRRVSSKGSKVYVEGRLQTRQWQDQNGNTKYTTEIVAREMKMLDSRQGEMGIGNKEVKSKYELLTLLGIDYGPAMTIETPINYSWN